MVLKCMKYTGKLLTFKILGNNELRVLHFGYVVAVNVITMSINFQQNLQVSLKLQPNLLNIAPNELKLVLWIKGVEVNIPIKFERNPNKLKFL